MISIEKLESHHCRTCYSASKCLKPLTSTIKCGSDKHMQHKSYSDLLKEVSNINIMEDSCKDLPQFICGSCIRKLKTTHAFIQQAQKVNERLMLMSMLCQVETNKELDCLEETQVDIQSSLEIKMEHEGRAEEVSRAQEYVELTPDVPKEFPQYNDLNIDISSIKTDNSVELQTNLEKYLYGVNDVSNFKPSPTISENENKDIYNTILAKENNQTLSNLKTYVNISKDEDAGDSELENFEWIEEKDSSDTKKNNVVKSSEDEDIAVPCSQCNKIFRNFKTLALHQRTSHIPEDKKCACPLCFRKFSRSCNMYTHMRTFHGPDSVPLLRKPSEKERIFQCDKCTRNYTKKKHLNIHIKNKHSHENDNAKHSESDVNVNARDVMSEKNAPNLVKRKRYEVRSLCSICGTSLSSKTHLIEHIRRHTGERPYKCDLCERAYPLLSELVRHRRIHTGEKPFKCKICNKAFRVSSKMTNHMRSHSDVRPYKCSQCERSFKYSKDLNIHFRLHTGERPYCCNVCGSTFVQSNTLKAHRLKSGHLEEDIA